MNLSEYTGKNTKGIAGLSNQLCAVAVEMGFLVPIQENLISSDSDSLVHQYLHPLAKKSLSKVSAQLEKYRDDAPTLIISTAYRTLAQQFILWQNKGPGQLVARTGRSDHGNGRSIDVINWLNCQNMLANNGWEQSYPSNDPVHWDYPDVPDNRERTVQAFQQLWNRNHPNNKIAEDGMVGFNTLSALGKSPCNGFAIAPIPRIMSIGSMGSDVGECQLALKALGFLKGSCDMFYGEVTANAVRSFQEKFQYPVTGIIDNDTLRKIQLEHKPK